MTKLLQLPAPAKINRFLHVKKYNGQKDRRADGYHAIETQFQFLTFADRMTFAPAAAKHGIRRIDRHDFDLPEIDLSMRAAQLLRDAHGNQNCGVTITLDKIIPPGGGLGGGSSNAATALLALNHLWQLGLSRTRLAELGLELGADVPVFVHGRAANAHGIGELLTPCDIPSKWICLCLPPVEVSTARVFAQYDLMGDAQKKKSQGDAQNDTTLKNDLEFPCAKLYPPVAETLAALRDYGTAKLSGSGAAVFAEFDSRDAATRTAKKLKARLPDIAVSITQSVNRHPLLNVTDYFGDDCR